MGGAGPTQTNSVMDQSEPCWTDPIQQPIFDPFAILHDICLDTINDKHWKAPWLATAAERGAPVDLFAPTAGQGHPLPPLYILPPIYPALVFGMVGCIMEAFFMPKFLGGGPRWLCWRDRGSSTGTGAYVGAIADQRILPWSVCSPTNHQYGI